MTYFTRLLNRIRLYLLTLLNGTPDEVYDRRDDECYAANDRLDKEVALGNDLTGKVAALMRLKEVLQEENKKLADAFNRIKRENEALIGMSSKRTFSLSDQSTAMNNANRAVERIQREKTDLLVKLGIAEESLRDERDGHRVLNDTNRALEARLKVIMDEMFPAGHGMYIHYYDAVTRTSRPFKIPLKMQKQISKLLSPGQKKKVKKAKAADGNV